MASFSVIMHRRRLGKISVHILHVLKFADTNQASVLTKYSDTKESFFAQEFSNDFRQPGFDEDLRWLKGIECVKAQFSHGCHLHQEVEHSTHECESHWILSGTHALVADHRCKTAQWSPCQLGMLDCLIAGVVSRADWSFLWCVEIDPPPQPHHKSHVEGLTQLPVRCYDFWAPQKLSNLWKSSDELQRQEECKRSAWSLLL